MPSPALHVTQSEDKLRDKSTPALSLWEGGYQGVFNPSALKIFRFDGLFEGFIKWSVSLRMRTNPCCFRQKSVCVDFASLVLKPGLIPLSCHFVCHKASQNSVAAGVTLGAGELELKAFITLHLCFSSSSRNSPWTTKRRQRGHRRCRKTTHHWTIWSSTSGRGTWSTAIIGV